MCWADCYALKLAFQIEQCNKEHLPNDEVKLHVERPCRILSQDQRHMDPSETPSLVSLQLPWKRKPNTKVTHSETVLTSEKQPPPSVWLEVLVGESILLNPVRREIPARTRSSSKRVRHQSVVTKVLSVKFLEQHSHDLTQLLECLIW